MSKAKPKIEGSKKFRRPVRASGQPTKKEFVTKVLGLKSQTFDIGNAKYAAKYKKTVDTIVNYIHREYKGGADIAKAIKALSLPTLQVPWYPKAKARETTVNPGDVYIWQQDVQLEENKKRVYALIIGQRLPNLDSKLQGSALFVQAKADQDVSEGTSAALTAINRVPVPLSKSKSSSFYILPGPRCDQHSVCGALQGSGWRGQDLRRCVWSKTRIGGGGARCSGNEV